MVRGNYLSVFLELSAGLPETSKYEKTFFSHACPFFSIPFDLELRVQIERSIKQRLFTRLLFVCCCSGTGMNTAWKWSIKPPAILQRTSFGSLRLTLKSVNAGVTTASSDWTFWRVKVT